MSQEEQINQSGIGTKKRFLGQIDGSEVKQLKYPSTSVGCGGGRKATLQRTALDSQESIKSVTFNARKTKRKWKVVSNSSWKTQTWLELEENLYLLSFHRERGNRTRISSTCLISMPIKFHGLGIPLQAYSPLDFIWGHSVR